ncbi:terminase large subunit [Caloramator proteoclasticus]|uniref:Phage terminase-like protein, large subunit, contains N-terminal HTH domain n=1 Tax=Caloramator proteoclasticus DSM 10124 TaxID=1121262 RepID=A0A1M4ZG50_9CLOT|nr:terminase TerL endonuclease subunit [Caloramator proteoclasticus]SHF16556.1 Phage terminase-like protein, large subunit, contains N-terminal HTH domain [Caloramator proteoclasticus DSM 10124]
MSRKITYPFAYNPILEYWEQIITGKVVVSRKVYKVYEELARIISDANSEWEYNPKKANHAIEFIENYCKHSKGKMGGKPFIMELWQKALVAATFGIVHKIDGTRKYQEVLLIVARKNGKSTLAAAIGLYLMIADGEPGAEIYAAATKKDQAKIIWLEAKRMVKKSPSLSKRIKTLVAELTSEFNDSSFKPLGSDSDTLDGLNVHGALLDEIHAWNDKNLYDVIVDGTTAREQPLIFITTTAGTVRESVYDIKYDEAEKVINGYNDENGYKNERLLPIIYELDKREEWTDEKCWQKANPGLGTIKSIDQLRNKVNKAIANPLLVKNLLCKDFNIRETTSEAWLTFEQLNNPATYDLGRLKPKYGIGGADLSSTTDLTCATVIFMVRGDNTIYVMQMYWLPEDLLEQRVLEDKIPYDIWRNMGLLRTVPGNKVHYKYVTEWFLEVQNQYGIYIPWIGYDSWSATYWVEEMKSYFGEESMEPVIQGKKTLSGPMKNMGADLEAKRINYNNNPILKWCLSNTSIEIDKNLNIQPSKSQNQRRRIDGTASLLNAYVTLERHYEDYQNMI